MSIVSRVIFREEIGKEKIKTDKLHYKHQIGIKTSLYLSLEPPDLEDEGQRGNKHQE